jgi:hypothetical protein
VTAAVMVREVWTGCPFCLSPKHAGPCALIAATRRRLIVGLTDPELAVWEDRAELAMVTALTQVMDQIATRIGSIQTAAGLDVLLAHMPGKHNQASHGRGGGGGVAGQAALDATPAKLTPGPRGHFGDYEGESLSGPDGVGSARALSEYEGVEYETTNSYLRRGPTSESSRLSPEQQEFMRPRDVETEARIADIDQTMAGSRLSEDVQVERVIHRGHSVFGDGYHNDDMTSDDFDRQDAGYERWMAGERPDLTGMRFRDKGYVSTSADPRIDEAFGGRWARTAREMPSSDGEPIVMRIQAPKGTGAVALGEMGEIGPRGITGSAEILLDRGLTFEVTADHGVDDKGFRRLDVSVVPDG